MLELIKSVLFLSKHCSLGLKLQPFYFSCNTSDSYPLEILVTSLLNTIPVCSLSLLPPLLKNLNLHEGQIIHVVTPYLQVIADIYKVRKKTK